jgi:two-component system, response regulator PdtaR
MSDVLKFPPKFLSVAAERYARSEPRSIRYRRRASRLGQLADAEETSEGVLTLMQQALAWIQLAENEELLDRADKCPIVLVVEDTPMQRFDAVSMIERAGFETLEAASADDAISILESSPNVDVVFTDIKMPGSMDGLKLAAAIKARWPSITVVATSGVMDIRDEQLPEGCLFVPKPYSAEQVVGALQGMVRAS